MPVNQNTNGQINIHLHVGLDMRKPVFGVLQTTKVQTSLCNAQSGQRLGYSLYERKNI